MLFLISFVFASEHYYNSKGYYSLRASKNDILSFSLQNTERAFIFSSLNQNECFIFPEYIDHSAIPVDMKAFGFDNSNLRINISSNVNISIWIIQKSFCHPNSIFIMASYKYSLQIKPKIKKNDYINEDNYFNYCIFSPSLLEEYRKLSFRQQKTTTSSFSKCNIYSMNVFTPDYQTEGEYIEAVLSNSFFLKISTPADSNSSNQIIESSFIDEKSQDNTFISTNSNSFYSFTYFYTDNKFVQYKDWIDNSIFNYKNPERKKFSWVWIVIILIAMIILLLLSLFIIYFVIKKRNGSSSESVHEDPTDECIPDAQSINQIPAELNDEDDEKENSKEKVKNKKLKQSNGNKNQDDNPYSMVNVVEDGNQEDSETIDPNVVEINPYSLPKA